MELSKIEGYAEALKIFERNVSPRYQQLQNLENWAQGRQYNGLSDWFNQKKPLWERAPCFVYLLTRESIESKVDLVLGEGRFPEITSSPGEGDPLADVQENGADQSALSKQDSKLIDAFIGRALKQAKFYSAAREALFSGQEVSTAVLIFGVRKSKLFCDTTKAQWCEPTLDVDGECLKLEIKYPYLDPYKDDRGRWKMRVRLFRRVIDDKTDTTYLPGDAKESGEEPQWVEDKDQVFKHNLGFCPVVWYPFMRGCSAVNQIDGHAPHELLLDEIRCLDFSLSQRHRAALYAGDPQWTECGVTPGFNPTAPARTAMVPGTPDGGPVTGVTGSNPPTTYWGETGGDSQPARMKSPGGVWQYPNKDTKVELHTLPPDALKAVSEHAGDFRMKVCEMLAHVPLDPDAISHIRNLSGKALESLRKRELNRCDRIRDDFGDNCLLPAINLILRICGLYISQRSKDLNLAGLKKVAGILTQIQEDDELSLRLVWGDYDDPDPTEENQIVTATVTAHKEGVITDRMAMSKLAGVYDIENVDEAVDALRDEKADRQALALAQTQAEQASLHALVNNDGERAPGRAGKKESAGPSGRRSGSAAATDASA